MRRLLLIAATVAIVVAACAGVASARMDHRTAPRPVAAPFHAPAAMPRPDRAQPGAWGFRTSDALARDISGASSAPSAPAASGGASITVTATVLPVVFLVVDRAGHVRSITTNTEARDATGVLYLVRSGSTSGAARPLTPATWRSARAALAHAHAGTGTVWSA